jgi:photosystem II stability/assembly factor-like uncharacterized protein
MKSHPQPSFFLHYIYLFAILFLHTQTQAQWLSVGGPLNENITTFGVSGNYFYSGTDKGLYLSANNWASWSVLAATTNTDVTALSVNGANLVVGTFNSGMFLSNSAGGSFTNTLNSAQLHAVVASGNTIFAGTHTAGIYLSTNNGSTWTQVNNGLTDANIHTLVISGSNIFAGSGNSGVFLSTNNGASWTAINNGLPNNVNVFSMVVVGSNIYLGTYGNGIFFSNNNGASWTPISSSIPVATIIYSIAVSGNKIFAGTDKMVYFTTQTGNSFSNWSASNNGLPVATVYSLFLNGTTLYAGTAYKGIWKRDISQFLTPTQDPKASSDDVQIAIIPNPSASLQTLNITTPNVQDLKISLMDMTGREVQQIYNGKTQIGDNRFDTDLNKLPSGIYIYRITRDGHIQNIKTIKN